jgi:hypothetical protein
MEKQIKIIFTVAIILSLTSCEDGMLSPARDVGGIRKGTLTSSENNTAQLDMITDVMVLNLIQDENNITGEICFGSYCGDLTGTISGTTIEFTAIIGNGCINVHGTFTSTNMEGMKNSNPPRYLTCGDALNDGHGLKGIEWHVVKI